MKENKENDANIVAGIVVAVLIVGLVTALALPIWYRRRKALVSTQEDLSREAGQLLSFHGTARSPSLSACSNGSCESTPALRQQPCVPPQPDTFLDVPRVPLYCSSLADSETPQTDTATFFHLQNRLSASSSESAVSQEQRRRTLIHNVKSPAVSIASPTTQAALSGLPGHPFTRPSSVDSYGPLNTTLRNISVTSFTCTHTSIDSPGTQAQLTAMPSYALEDPPTVYDAQVLSPMTMTQLTGTTNQDSSSHRRNATLETTNSPLVSPMSTPAPHKRTINPLRATYVEMDSPVYPRSRQATFVLEEGTLKRVELTTPPPEKAFRYG